MMVQLPYRHEYAMGRKGLDKKILSSKIGALSEGQIKVYIRFCIRSGWIGKQHFEQELEEIETIYL